MIALVDAINTVFVANLARLGHPPLTDHPNGDVGHILVGDPHQYLQHVPPRVIFRPVKSSFAERDTTRGLALSGQTDRAYTADDLAAISMPAFLSDMQAYEVACWGICPVDEDVDPRAPELDYDFTEGLYKVLLASMHEIAGGSFVTEGGTWRNLKHVQRVGREFVFTVVVGVPVLIGGAAPPGVTGWTPGQASAYAPKAAPPPVTGVQTPADPFAPPSTAIEITDEFVLPTGESEAGCEEA